MFKVFLNKCQSDIWYLGSTLLVYNINQPLLKRFLYLEDRPADALVCKWPIQLTSTNSPNYISLNHHFARAPPCSPSLLEWWGPVSKIPHSTSRSSSSTATLPGLVGCAWHDMTSSIERDWSINEILQHGLDKLGLYWHPKSEPIATIFCGI